MYLSHFKFFSKPQISTSLNWNKIMHSRSTSNLYLRLLCRFEPQNVLQFLKTNDSYDIDECLHFCSIYEIHKASAYLLERKGDLKGAFEVYIRDIDTINCQLIQKEFVEKSLYDQADEACTLAMSLCIRSYIGQRHAESGDGHSRNSLWYHLFVTYVDAFKKAERFPKDEAKKQLLGYMKRVLGGAAPYIDTQAIAANIIEDYQDTIFSNLQEILHMLLDFSDFELQTSSLAHSISKKENVESIWYSYFQLTRGHEHK